MSAKHHQRTRAQILAKREQPIIEVPVFRKLFGGVRVQVLFKRDTSRSKYMPHIGAKEQARAARSSMDSWFLPWMWPGRNGPHGSPRSAAVMCQRSK